MARPGVTYTEVAEIATHLIGQGKNPTIEQIRLLLGSGSSTTIANHLKQWKEHQQGTSLLAAKENVPQELISMVKGLWERVMNLSQEQVSVAEASFKQTVAELQADLHKYKTNNQRWQHLLTQWQQEKERLIVERVSLKEEIESLQAEKHSLEVKLVGQASLLQEKQHRVTELRDLYEQALANQERERISAKEQRQVENEQFESQKQSLMKQLDETKEQLAIYKEKSAALQHQKESLTQANAHLMQNYEKLSSTLEDTKTKLIESESEKQKYSQSSEHWQALYNLTDSQLEAQRQYVIDTQVEIKTLFTQLGEVKESWKVELEKNKALERAYWLLSQEKVLQEEKDIS